MGLKAILPPPCEPAFESPKRQSQSLSRLLTVQSKTSDPSAKDDRVGPNILFSPTYFALSGDTSPAPALRLTRLAEFLQLLDVLFFPVVVILRWCRFARFFVRRLRRNRCGMARAISSRI